MEAYLQAFVNFEQNDWAGLLSMAEFAYNNAKNATTSHTPFKLNCGYYPRILSVRSSRQASLQTQTTKEVEDTQCFSHVTARAGHHKEEAGRESTEIRRRW